MNFSKIEKIIKDEYNIKNIIKIEKNENSSQGNVYIIYTHTKNYVVKKYKELSHAKSMIEIHNFLEDNDFNSPIVYKNNNKIQYSKLNDDSYIVLYSFMIGKELGYEDNSKTLDLNIVENIAKAIKKFHNITREFNNQNIDNIPFKIEKEISRKSLLHFDLTRSNIFNNNGKIGIIDFDDVKFGASVCDVAIAIANLFFSKSRGIDEKGYKKFIEVYYSDEKEEIKDIEIPMIKDIAIKWINYVLNTNSFDASDKESFEVRKKLIEMEKIKKCL